MLTPSEDGRRQPRDGGLEPSLSPEEDATPPKLGAAAPASTGETWVREAPCGWERAGPGWRARPATQGLTDRAQGSAHGRGTLWSRARRPPSGFLSDRGVRGARREGREQERTPGPWGVQAAGA